MRDNHETLTVPEGYKQTEVGIIPEDWFTSKIGDVLTIKHGRSQKDVEIENGAYPILGTGGIIGTAKDYLYKQPSVLIGRKGTINKPVYMETPFWTVDTLFYSEIYKGNSAKFLYYKFKMIDWMQYNEASGVPSLNAHTIEQVVISYPALKEQTAIANALSDVDALIAELEKLIEKKEAIKTGTMQQLLTGKTRLPQFAYREDGTKKGYKSSELGEIPEDWDVVKVADLVGNRKELFDDGDWIESKYITNQGIRLIQTGNIGVGSYIEKEDRKYISADSFVQLKCKELNIGDILICRLAEPAGRACLFPGLIDDRVITSVDVTIFRPLKNISRGFYVQYFSTKEWFSSVSQHVGGTTHKRISRGSLAKILVPLPIEDEQVKIAEILSSMDSEIQALENRLEKTKLLKQGMMQELLTGRTRLV